LNKSAADPGGRGMANFKRKGPKSTRSGCLLCKPHKRQGAKCAHTARETAKRAAAAEDIRFAGG
jgi:hypothetical protein